MKAERGMNMEHTIENGRYKSADGIHSIFYEIVIPSGEPKAIVQISHGMCEYFGRYRDFAEFLADNGFIVCGNDHLGHGSSVESDDELGYFSENDGWQNAVKDLHSLTKLMKRRYRGLPYFLFGHSMGSFLARAYAFNYADELTAAVFCGTSGGVVGIDGLIDVVNAVRRTHGEMYRSDRIHQLAFGTYNRRVENSTSEHDWISRDKETIEKYAGDKKCTFNFTVNGYRNLLGVLQYVSSKKWYDGYKKTLPTYIISGDGDPVGSYGKGPYKVFSLLSKRKNDVRLRLYSGARHELLNELNRQEVYSDLLAFFEYHI